LFIEKEKKMNTINNTIKSIKLGITCLTLFVSVGLIAQNEYKEFSGEVIDGNTNRPLESVNISLLGLNLSTVTNSEGKFVLKVPIEFIDSKLLASFLGYNSYAIPLSELNSDNNTIELFSAVTQLSEVNISAFKDARALVKRVFDERDERLQNESVIMTAFYRETIKRRRRNVSLTEAVVDIYKEPYSSLQKDAIELGKARKSTDYRRLDTLSVKLMGGPYSTVYLDVMKYPEYLFSDDKIDNYSFEFKEPSKIGNRQVFNVFFRSSKRGLNLYYRGNLYIDTQTLALVRADYNIDLSDKSRTKNLLVKRKPSDVVVEPLEARYKVDYRVSGNKWYFSYSNLLLSFKVNKKRQLFNKTYTLSSEMAVTDWEINSKKKRLKSKDRLKSNVIMADAVSGFSDPDFWGEYNLIEPDKSIESAIEKIRKSIEKEKNKEETEQSQP
jgi:hypothetical protein